MMRWLLNARHFLARADARVMLPLGLGGAWLPLEVGWFLVGLFARIPLVVGLFLIELPIQVSHQPTASFTLLARRSDNLEYLDSYTNHIRKYRWSVATTLALLIGLVAQVTFFADSLIHLGQPTNVQAYSSSVTLNPTYDVYNHQETDYTDDGGGGCAVGALNYFCDGSLNPYLVGGANTAHANCSVGDVFIENYASAMKFDLSSIPSNATITSVQLALNVTVTTTGAVSIVHPTSDTPNTLTCSDSTYWEALASPLTTYLSGQSWGTTGTKNYTLGSAAITDVQNRINTTKVFAVGLVGNLGNRPGGANSVESATNKPQLTINYTLPPQAPSNTGHGSISTSTIGWTWTDNATAETRYDVDNGSESPVTGCTNLAANTQSCTETGLSANTQYTRHPVVTDPNGTTDGPSAAVYTAIESPSGVTFGSITSSSIALSATGSFSNLSTASSGLWFQENSTSANSGWLTTNSWTKSSLTANSQYSFQTKSRNGDAVENSLTSASLKYTLSLTPNATSTRATATWYATAGFPFTNVAGWGGGGVQYYRYAWDQVATHTFAGTESTWGDTNAHCPGGTCTDAGTTLTKTATVDANNWYLHVQAFNGDNAANGAGTDYGPYYFDGTNPPAPATVNDGLGADASYTTSTSQLSANWTAVTDATSGVQKYQYAIGTSAGGSQVQGFTDNGTGTSMTQAGLSLTNGSTYYVSVRVVDNAGNIGAATSSNGVLVNTSLPIITNNQTGDATPRNQAGTTYNVQFSKAPTGPQIDYAQYTVYGGPVKSGSQVKNWTNIFSGAVDAYTTPWTVDFTSLSEGKNYVSVLVHALDGQTDELDDAFTITKDTVAPAVSSVTASGSEVSATITWSTDEPASSQAVYGLTSAYGSSSVLDATLVTGHSVSLTGLTAGTTYHFAVISSDQAGNQTQSADATVATTASATAPTVVPATSTPSPASTAPPTITNLQDGSLTGDTKPTIAGTGPANGSIYIAVDGHLARTVPVDAAGRYLVDLADDLALGPHTVYVRTRTTAGLISDPSTPITITVVRPSRGITVQKKIIADGSMPSLTYYAVAPGQTTVEILLDDSVYKTLDATHVEQAYGFIVTLPVPPTLSPGRHRWSLVAIDASGRPSVQAGKTIFDVPTRLTAAAPIQYHQSTQYTVKTGDSLWSIAQALTGDGHHWTKLRLANVNHFPSLTRHPQTLRAGWILTIPPT